MTPYLSFISKRATGTMLQFAAIGVISVPQYPHVRAKRATLLGSYPWDITKGTPMPTVITENAAKPFPIKMVNRAMEIA